MMNSNMHNSFYKLITTAFNFDKAFTYLEYRVSELNIIYINRWWINMEFRNLISEEYASSMRHFIAYISTNWNVTGKVELV